MMTQIVERELVDLEKRFWQAMKDQDVETAMSLTDEPCIVTGPQGIGRIGRTELAEMMRHSGSKLRSFDVRDVETRMLGDDVAIVAYKIHEEVTVDGKTVGIDAADASTWVRRDGRWVCACHTEAIAGDPYGRDRTQPH